MNIVDRIVSYARVELGALYAEYGIVPEEALNEALVASCKFTSDRLNVEIADDYIIEAKFTLEGMFNVFVGAEHTLANNEGHEEWLERKKDEISWEYWGRYRQWLIEDEHRPPSIIDDSMSPITDHILGMLEDPLRSGAWSRRGLVAGQVQSGKTSNYVGLVNKALDAGYKLIIVLAGTHDNLRSQTQIRINSGVLGFDSEGNINGSLGKRVGVGLKDGRKPRINCPTSSAQKGDFNRHLAKGVGTLGGDPVILVIKKNVHILSNLISWATAMHHEIDPVTGKRLVRNVPLLVIDDEADYASIDTGSITDKETGIESDPSKTNLLIRQFLNAFEKSAYVGYTATPFANIFINPLADHKEFGKDLFPEHFIVTLPESSAYSGASRVFGLAEDESAGIEAVEALPTTRVLDDYSEWLPDGHKKEDIPELEIPASLQQAVHSFVLASALKRFRKLPMKHNSMLVHVTRFILVQAEVTRQLSEFVDSLRVDVIYSKWDDEGSDTWGSLRDLYESDFISTHEIMSRQRDMEGQIGVLPEFGALEEQIRLVAEEIQVKAINGESKEALLYDESPDGVTVIAVGGDKLSRGLTLDGLTTSYYLRASKMYDTLMQMGRWFGFRPGYLDVCRLYTTSQLVTWYTRITAASERLYREFELMAALGRTPKDFGLRIQMHPDGLMVTASNKSRFSKNIKASFSGTISETILFREEEATRKHNLKQLKDLVSAVESCPSAQKMKSREFYWREVPASIVLDFVNEYDAHRGAIRALPKAMAEYIQLALALEVPELVSWDVLVASRADSSERFQLTPDHSVGLILRSGEAKVSNAGSAFVIKRIVSSGDELLPLRDSGDKWDQALSLVKDNWRGSTRSGKSEEEPESPTPVAERRVRDRSRGFMMIYPLQRVASGVPNTEAPYVGFALSFPWSENTPTVNYQVNEVYWDLEMAKTLEADLDEE